MIPKNCPHGAGYRYGNYDINSDKPTEYWCAKCEEERLRRENEMMRAALDRLADQENYSNEHPDAMRKDIEFWWSDIKFCRPWEFAQSVKDKLERGE